LQQSLAIGALGFFQDRPAGYHDVIALAIQFDNRNSISLFS
jgi:hypothetical protein